VPSAESAASLLGHGDVWWADVDDDKIRPVVVLTRRRIASRLTRVVVAPVTSTVRDMATEVHLGAAEGVRDGSVANLDNVHLIDVDRLLRRAGRIGPERWPEFCRAVASMMAC
jgi:mRNA interferase MazF